MTPRAPYQDIWRHGKLVRPGRRGCLARYEILRDALKAELGLGFRVLDVGGWDGYFVRRLEEDLYTVGTLLDQRDPPDLQGYGIGYLQLSLRRFNVGFLPSFDAILVLSVLHHLADWETVLRELMVRSQVVVLELPTPAELEKIKRVPTAPEVVAPSWNKVQELGPRWLGETEGPNGLNRPLFLVRCSAPGTVRDGSGQARPLMLRTQPRQWSELGYMPYPGTLNVYVRRQGREWIRELPGVRGPALGRSGKYVPVSVNGYPAHARTTRSHTVVELVAEVRLRDQLSLQDGDPVEIRRRG
jgi:hypothetical protein